MRTALAVILIVIACLILIVILIVSLILIVIVILILTVYSYKFIIKNCKTKNKWKSVHRLGRIKCNSACAKSKDSNSIKISLLLS